MKNEELTLLPVLTTETPRSEQVPGHGEILNGVRVNLRKTHPALWRSLMVYAAVNILLGLNFLLLQPTFLIYHLSNYWWGAAFLALGIAKIVFANIYRNLRLVRMTMAAEVVFMVWIALGACEPWLDGNGSLQLPIVYLAFAALEAMLLLEPFINPLTARRD